MLTKQRVFLKPLTIIEIVSDDDMKPISLHLLLLIVISDCSLRIRRAKNPAKRESHFIAGDA